MRCEMGTIRETKRTGLVTGSSNGIGAAIVRRLAELDFKLVVTGRAAADLDRVCDECERLSPSGLRPVAIAASLELESECERLLSESLEHFGGRLDLLVNNAGLALPQADGTPATQLYANFKRIMRVNLDASVQLTLMARDALEQTARECCAGRPTSVIQVSSIAADRPFDDWAYCISKRAMSMFSNCMASQMAPLVRVNTVAPGFVDTKIIERSGNSSEAIRMLCKHAAPLQRIGQSHEVVSAVEFLADQERASYITGAQLTVDGGFTWAQMDLSRPRLNVRIPSASMVGP